MNTGVPSRPRPTTVRRAFSPCGSALIWVLLLGGFMAVVVIAFLTTAQSDRRLARNDQGEIVTEELLMAAQQEVLAKLSEGFSVEAGVGTTRQGHVAATPGLLEVRRYDVGLNRGTQTGSEAFRGTASAPAFFSQPFSAQYEGAPANPRWIPLFSWKAFAPRLRNLSVTGTTALNVNPDYNPALSFNLNTPQNPFMPGVCLLSGVDEGAETILREKWGESWANPQTDEGFTLGTGGSAAERPVWVQWIPVLKDPSQPPGPKNRIVGRYAYWVDVENSKLRADKPVRDLRQQPHYPRLIGEPDAIENGGPWFEQGEQSSARILRQKLESLLPATKDATTEEFDPVLQRNNTAGPGFAAGAASEARHTWLGWVNGERPAAADASLVDWSFFEAPWPSGMMGVTPSQTFNAYRQVWASNPRMKPVHPWFFKPEPGEGELQRAHDQLLRQVATSALTMQGYEEEVDPLGRAKLSLTDFQLSVTSHRTQTVSIDAIKASTIWQRLGDSAYSHAYYPGLVPTQGTPRSFFDTWNRFAGTGNEENPNNGAAATLQMLVNIAEFAQPDTVPPLIDTTQGIVGARSMPYVAEVGTRARSAFWLLPEAVRNNTDALLARNGAGSYTFTHNGKTLQYYATHVVLDLVLGFINPNPYETEPFDGEIEVDVAWGTLPSGSSVNQGPFRRPLRGHYTATPEPGKDPKATRVPGQTVRIELGTLPATALNDQVYATALQIKGWKIYRNGVVWHQVPVKHPGGRGVRQWWEMAQSGQNAGGPNDDLSLADYQAANSGYRAVGWFTKPTMDGIIPESLYVSSWLNAADNSSGLQQRVQKWASRTPRTAVLERVACIDPVLGHHTGDPGLTGLFGEGHFYGALGHPWRRLSLHQNLSAPIASGLNTTPKAAVIKARSWTILPGDPSHENVLIRRGVGQSLRTTTSAWTIPHWSVTETGTETSGEMIVHEFGEPPSSSATLPTMPLESLTALYLAPSIESNAPQGSILFEEYFKEVPLGLTEKAGKSKGIDVEVATPPADNGDFTKLPDGKKGPRGLFCSAPAKRPCVSVGELGFVHSGFPQTPLMVGPDEGHTSYQLNSPRNGLPMRVLMDLFAAPRFTDASGGGLTEQEWMAGSGSTSPKRHAWNINTTIAHDDYMALRQGGSQLAELKKEVSPGTMPAHAVWLPNAQGFSRRTTGADAFRGKDVKGIYEKDPGYLLDRHLRPFPALARPWDMWVGVVGGDFSPGRSGESNLWGVGNTASLYFGPGLLTWRPGNGAGSGTASPWIDFKSDPPGLGRLLAFGEDGRKDDSNNNAGYLRGRFASDQNLAALDPTLTVYVPPHYATRFGLLPMRHFVSDLAVDFLQTNAEGNWSRFKTALNPGIGAEPLPAPSSDLSEEELAEAQKLADKVEGAAYPGGYHMSGVFYHAPMALLTNQAGVSANAFTAYVVVQALQDTGTVRPGVTNSGPGHCDPDDTVIAERWARVLITKETTTTGQAPVFRVNLVNVAGR